MRLSGAFATIAFAALASSAHSAVIYSLAADGSTLIRFDSANPGAVTTVGPVSGAITSLAGLDFRPANGLLYGYAPFPDRVFLVDAATGETTLVSTSTEPVTTQFLGIDFNPTVDRLRLVTVNDENRRINVENGVAIADTSLAYAAGDINAGVNPNILDVGYTNHDVDPATGTTLYYIDYQLDALVTTSAPNAGTLVTVGSLGVDTDAYVGFDIFTDLSGNNIAYASLRVGGFDNLYTIDLGTGAASLVGSIGARQLFGLAVAPAAIPEPGALSLIAVAALAALGLRRRGRRIATAH